MKRTLDIIVSAVGLVTLSPILFLIFVMVKMDSPGPGFYLQDRVGLGGKAFKLLKFRTMHVDADRLTAITVGARDPRIARLGYYLRKFKLDELPQLINVLRGEMSLVGPRPELKKFVDLYTPEQLKILTVRPGITDLASLKFRNENALLEGKPDPIRFYIEEIMPVKLEIGLKYIEQRSLAMDLRIIAMTIFSIFRK